LLLREEEGEMSRKLTGDSWSYSFSSFKIIEGTFNILKGIYDANGSVHTKTLSSWINEVTDGKEDSPRKFLVDLGLIEKVSGVYNITDRGRELVESMEKGMTKTFSIKVFDMIKERYQVARYLDKFISPPGRQTFKKEEFVKFVINEWLLDFGYEKNDHVDRDNVLAVAEYLGLIKRDRDRNEYIIDKDFKIGFFDIGFLATIKELAKLRNEWPTIDLCKRLQDRHGEYMQAMPDLDFILDRLIDLQIENSAIIEFSPGWPTPPIPPAFAFIRFSPTYVDAIRTPKNWKEYNLIVTN